MNKLLKYLLQGILLVVPLAITVVVIIKILTWIDNIIPDDFITLHLPGIGKTSIGAIPGIGILTLLISLTVLGFLGNTFIAEPFMNYFKRLLNKAPLIKVIYTSVKDLVGAFVGKEKKFTKSVMVKMEGDNLYRLGFITAEDLSNLGVSKEFVAVYFPHSYAISGNVFLVESKNVIKINAKSADVMKFIVSGGVTQVDKDEPKQ